MKAPTSSDLPNPPTGAPTSDPLEGRSQRALWAECRDAIWKAQSLACMFAEMAWGVEQSIGLEELKFDYLDGSHLRMFAEYLVDELAIAAENIGELEPPL